MKILVLGKNSRLFRAFNEKLGSNYSFICFTRRPNASNEYGYDLSDTDIYELLKTSGVNTCINCLGHLSRNSDLDTASKHREILNIVFRFIDIMNKIDKSNWIELSSSTQYDFSSAVPVVKPRSLYSKYKCVGLQMLKLSENISLKEMVIFNVYGIPSLRIGIIDDIYRSLKEKTNLSLGPGTESLDFIHVEDVITAIHEVLLRSSKFRGNETFWIGSGLSITLKEMAYRIASYYGFEDLNQLKWSSLSISPSSNFSLAPSNIENFSWKPAVTLSLHEI